MTIQPNIDLGVEEQGTVKNSTFGFPSIGKINVEIQGYSL